MPYPFMSSGERERLAALHRYNILDTPAEEGFDRITRLAASWLDVPTALVTLVDETRVWLKSCVGLCRGKTDRDVSFCTHNLDEASLMVVEDATQDPRFADNPSVTAEPGIRFYAGAPLVTPEGHIVGSLCVIDTVPRSADELPLDVLQDLADVVVTELELRQKNEVLEERNRQVQALTQELEQAEEAARSQLSRLLQEELKQVLQAARMKLENVSANGAHTEAVGARLQDVVETLDDALSVTRTLSARFAPPVGNQPLRDTLEWLAVRMKEVHGLSVSVLGQGAGPIGDEAVKTQVYQLVRALLLRVSQHADPDEVHVSLVESAGHLRITVRDGDGAFGTGPLVNEAGALAQVREQVEELGGQMEVRRQGEAGPCITIAIPQTRGRNEARPLPHDPQEGEEELWSSARAGGHSDDMKTSTEE